MHLYSHAEGSIFQTSLDGGADDDFLIILQVLTAGQSEITDISRFPAAQGGMPPLSCNNCGI